VTSNLAAAATSVELHLHLEGALNAALARTLHEATPGLPPPPKGAIVEGSGGVQWGFDDLGGFLRCFGWATHLLRGPEVYVRIFDELAVSLRAQGVVYAEVFVAFGQMLRAEVDPEPVLRRLGSRAAEIEGEGGPSVWFIADVTRQWGVAAADKALDAALDLLDHRIVGFGMGGDERAERARAFGKVFRRAKAAGLGLCCHAGEGTDPDAVREAVEALGLTRVGHGVAAVADARLLRELRDERITLEVCPTSNECTGVWDPRAGEHPLARLEAAGVPVVLGSDDPAFFKTSLRAEVERARQWGFSEAQLSKWAANGWDAAFGEAAGISRERVDWPAAGADPQKPARSRES
jgi:adenosine deaminase